MENYVAVAIQILVLYYEGRGKFISRESEGLKRCQIILAKVDNTKICIATAT